MNGRMESEMKTDSLVKRKLGKLPDYIGKWYIFLKASDKTATTCREYVYKAEKFLNYVGGGDVAHVTVDDLTSDVVEAYMVSIKTRMVKGEEKATSDSYRCGTWDALNNLFGYLERRELIPRNYVKDIKRPSNHDLERINEHRIYLTESDFNKMLMYSSLEENKEFRLRDRAILLLFMTTGMRRAELINIMYDDWDWRKNTITVVGKRNKRHIYVLNKQTADAINDYLEWQCKTGTHMDAEHLFVSSWGNPLSTETVSNIVKKYSKKALGRELSPHKLRAGVATILYDKTKDINFTREYMGHTNVTTTQRYIVPEENTKEKGAEIMGKLFG